MLFLLLACRSQTAAPDGGEPVIALANCVGTMHFDAGNDANIDSIWIFTYNDRGEPESAAYDLKVDGEVDSLMSYVYEGDLLTERLWDGDFNGVVDAVTRYFYDEQLRLIESREGSVEVDSNLSLWTYRDDLKLLQQNFEGADLNVLEEEGYYLWEEAEDGVFYQASIQWHPVGGGADSLVRYVYNDRWQVVVEEVDTALDGVAEQRETYTWDDLGRKLTTAKDMNADGVTDYYSYWEYLCEQ